jgi:hypothetical protein
MLYDARLAKGRDEYRVELEWDKPLAVQGSFTYDGEIYEVTAVRSSNDEKFDAVIEATWRIGPSGSGYPRSG